MRLEANGKASPGECTRHFNIKCFCITDLVERDKIRVECCATDDSMTAGHMTKPVTGPKSDLSHNTTMNIQPKKKSVAQQECVGNGTKWDR